MPTVRANEINLCYEISGEGRPLVLIAGLGYGMWFWHKVIPGLAEHFQVTAYDNRGAGGSDKPAGIYNVQMMAEDCAGLLDALNVRDAIIVGHSMGGFIAQQLALTRPDLVGKLVLAATNFGGPHHVPVTPEAMAIMLDRSGDPLDVIRRGISVACAPGFSERQPEVVNELIAYRLTNPVPPAQYQSQMGVGLGLLSQEAAFEGKLKNITAPTLILFGEHDQVVPPANANLLQAEIANSQVVILPGAGHAFPIEIPGPTVETITRFGLTQE